MNYLLFYEPVERVLEEEAEDKETLTPSCYIDIAENIKNGWKKTDLYVRDSQSKNFLKYFIQTVHIFQVI